MAKRVTKYGVPWVGRCNRCGVLRLMPPRIGRQCLRGKDYVPCTGLANYVVDQQEALVAAFLIGGVHAAEALLEASQVDVA
jgi:hypothetical protein